MAQVSATSLALSEKHWSSLNCELVDGQWWGGGGFFFLLGVGHQNSLWLAVNPLATNRRRES